MHFWGIYDGTYVNRGSKYNKELRKGKFGLTQQTCGILYSSKIDFVLPLNAMSSFLGLHHGLKRITVI